MQLMHNHQPRFSIIRIISYLLPLFMIWFQGVQPVLAGTNSSIQEKPASAVSTVKYEDLVIDEARGKLYGADKAGSKIDVIDIDTLSVASSYLLTYGAAPTSLELSPDGNELAIAQSGLSQVKFINLNDDTMADLAAPLSGSSTKGYDVIYGRSGVLYVLSNKGVHVIDLTQTPHTEDAAQYVSTASDEKFGAISSDKNTLYYVTGTCCSGYNSLRKFDVSAALSKPVELGYTVLYNSGYKKNIRLSLISDEILLTSFGTVYNTTDLTPSAKNGQVLYPVASLPAHDFYVTVDGTSNPDRLHFFGNDHSYELSWLDTGANGSPGATVATGDGNTLFVSSTAGMMKFTIGTTPPGTLVALPNSAHHYLDLAIDPARNKIYGTDTSNRIDVVDMDTFAILDSYLLPAGAKPIGIDLSPDGNELAVALNGLEAILFLNPESGEEIARVTPQLTLSVYYQNQPFDLIYGRSGRLYSDGNPGSSGTDYIHVIDTSTHTWLGKSSFSVRTGAELAITADQNYLYANETFSPNNIYKFDIQTDIPVKIFQGPHGPVSASKFAISPDGTKVFTSAGQVWSGDMQSSLGSIEGGSGNLIEFIPNQGVVALSSSSTGGDLLRLVRTSDYRILLTMYPTTGGTIFEMESTPDGNQLIVNTSNGMESFDIPAITTPRVVSIVRANSNPTSLSSVDFTVNFSWPVTNVDLTDFFLSATGIVGASITEVNGSGAAYTVTVNTGSGDGTIRLDVIDDDSILDASDKPLGGVGTGNGDFTTGETYTVRFPMVSSITRINANPPSTVNMKFLVVFSEPVSNVDIADFSLTKTGATGAIITEVSGSSNRYNVTVNTSAGKGNGTVRLNLIDNDSILDSSSNPLGGVGIGNANFTSGETYTITRVPTSVLPTGTITDTTPTYKWSKVPGATKYEYQLFKGTALIYTKTAFANACSGSYCSNTPTNTLNTGAYKWKVRALAGGAWRNYSPYKTFTIPPSIKPGFWQGSWHEFYVNSASTQVTNFAIYVSVNGCGNYKITRTVPAAISNKHFSFSGSFYASGTFTTATTAQGSAGLSSFYIPGCGYVTGGPFSWTASWKHADQAPDLGDLADPFTITVAPELETPIILTVDPEK